eukprot:1343074-Amorphochlora_amoeboformis.AAC.1
MATGSMLSGIFFIDSCVSARNSKYASFCITFSLSAGRVKGRSVRHGGVLSTACRYQFGALKHVYSRTISCPQTQHG